MIQALTSIRCMAVLMGHLKCEWLGSFAWGLHVVTKGKLFDRGWANKPVAQLMVCSSASWHGARCVTCAVSRSGLVCSSWGQYDSTFKVL